MTRFDRAVDAAIAEENRRFLADPAAIAAAQREGDTYRRRIEAVGDKLEYLSTPLDICTHTGVPAGCFEVETCEQPAIACTPGRFTGSGDAMGWCNVCGPMMAFHEQVRPLKVDWSALGWTNGELMEAWGR